MFDFSKKYTFVDIANRTSAFEETNTTVSSLAAAVFTGDLDEDLPDQVTICVTVFADLGFVLNSYKHIWPSRTLPTWAFMNDTGHMNLSLNLGMWTDLRKGWWEGNEKMWLYMSHGGDLTETYGKLLTAYII